MAAARIRTSFGVEDRSGRVAGGIGGLVFSLIFAAFGLALSGIFAYSMLRWLDSWRWERGSCRVLASGVSDRLFALPPEEAAKESDPYRLAVRYQWERDGRSFTGDEVGGKVAFATRGRAAAAAAAYPAGAEVGCFVDPGDRSRAVLRRPRPWPLLMLAVPLLFFGVGVAGVVGSIRRLRRARKGTAAPRSRRALPGSRRGCALAGFGLFALFGAGFMVPFALPIVRALGSLDWDEVPCDIVWSGVEAHSGDDSTTYSVEVLYEYDHGGERFRANRYRFTFGSSSGLAGKQAVVDGLPPGTRTTCWVNPRDPTSAVLDRRLGGFMALVLFPAVFLLVGVAGIIGSLRSGRRKSQAVEWLPGTAPAGEGGGGVVVAEAGGAAVRELAGDAARAFGPGAVALGGTAGGVPRGPIALRPGKSRLGSFLGLLFFTLVWDGITFGFLFVMWRNGKLGQEGCATAFLSLFALVGLFLLAALPHQFLALFNPRAEATLSAALAPGVPVALAWTFRGAAGRIRRLTLLVEGREEATYRRGTSTTTDRRVFARLVLVDTTDQTQIAGGETLVALPADTMHSFSAPRNKIVWVIKLHGDIPRWPDVDDEVPITVYPTAMVEGS
jgi:hypothetical protein